MEDNEQNEEAASAVVFEELRALQRACGEADKNDQATALIHACIANGWDTRKRIVGALRQLGFNYKHVAMVLKFGTGRNPEQHRWRMDDDGSYSSIE